MIYGVPRGFAVRFQFNAVINASGGRKARREFRWKDVREVLKDGFDMGILSIGISDVTFFCDGA